MRLLLVDLSGIFWSSWHATAGKEIDAAYQSTVARVRRAAGNYDHAAICCDSGRSFRYELSGGTYKANRPPRDEAAIEQLRRAQEELEADGWPCMAAPGFEADDVIATIVRNVLETGEAEAYVMSSDKDLLALIEPGCSVLHATTGEVWGPEKVREKLGVDPHQVRDFLALCGDKSDNVPGIPGIGAVHAARLLGQFGSIPEIIKALDAPDVDGRPVVGPPAQRKSLIENLGILDKSIPLVTLRRDVPVDIDRALRRAEPKAPGDASWDGEAEFEDAPQETSGTPPPGDPPSPAVATKDTTTPARGPEEAGASTALAVIDSGWSHALEPRSTKDAYILARHLHASRLFGAYGNPNAVLATIIAGRELGIPALTSLRGFHIVEGRPTLSAALAVAVVLRSGKAKFLRPILARCDERSATWETQR